MYFDTLTLAAVAEELRATVLGGRIQRVMLTGPLSLGLEIYAHGRRHQLVASAHPQLARIHLLQGRLSRDPTSPTPMLLLLRKYVLGGRIVAIEQPALERVLLVSIVKASVFRNRKDRLEALGDEEALELPADEPPLAEDVSLADDEDRPATGEPLRCELIIEPQDRRSNIILVDDDNRILDSLKRVGPRMSSRVILPRQIYELPPPLERRDPRQATGEGMRELASSGTGDLARALVVAYRGVSPQVAREVVLRSLGRSSANVNDADLPHFTLAARLREIFSDPPAACLASGADGPVAYAPYRLSHLPGATPTASISAALETFYAAREQLTDHHQRRAALAAQLRASRERLERQQRQIAEELSRAQAVDQLRWEGEMIFAFLHSLSPGQTMLEVEGRQISLDPHRSPVEQAQARFKQYDKARSALAGLPERLAASETRLQGLAALEALLELGDSYALINQLAQEAEELGYLREQPEAGKQKRRREAGLRPLHLSTADGSEIWVGRSARQNDEVTFRIGRPNDLWLHARGLHGAHVILRSSGHEPGEASLVMAAGLAAYFSQARGEPSVAVDLCRRALVRKIPGGPPGLVTYRAERTLQVAPVDARMGAGG